MELKKILRAFFMTLTLCSVVIFTAAMPLSCRMSEEGVELVTVETQPPEILSFYAEDNSNLVLICSQKIEIEKVQVEAEDGSYFEENTAHQYSQDSSQVNFTLKEPAKRGINYTLSGSLKDDGGNQLTFKLPFSGINESPARLLLSEVRTTHSSSGGEIKKAEYVEFYVLKGGNTLGLEVVSGSDGEDKKYVFPDMEVCTGEYIVVHYRTVKDGLCISETGSDLTLSTATDSSASRDLWIENTESAIGDNDVIILRDSGRNTIIDAVLFCASGKEKWYYKEQTNLAAAAFAGGVWEDGSDVTYATCSDNITLLRTLNRLNIDKIIEANPADSITEDTVIKACKDDWAVVTSATPGVQNLTEVYKK